MKDKIKYEVLKFFGNKTNIEKLKSSGKPIHDLFSLTEELSMDFIKKCNISNKNSLPEVDIMYLFGVEITKQAAEKLGITTYDFKKCLQAKRNMQEAFITEEEIIQDDTYNHQDYGSKLPKKTIKKHYHSTKILHSEADRTITESYTASEHSRKWGIKGINLNTLFKKQELVKSEIISSIHYPEPRFVESEIILTSHNINYDQQYHGILAESKEYLDLLGNDLAT